jgi:hypothetical protein
VTPSAGLVLENKFSTEYFFRKRIDGSSNSVASASWFEGNDNGYRFAWVDLFGSVVFREAIDYANRNR